MGIEDLVALAKKRGIDTIALADHDCMAGNVRGKIIGERFGVTVVPGVELSSTDAQSGREVHLLCYQSDFPDRLEGLCRRNSLERKKAAHYMMLKTAQRYPITTELVVKCATGSTNLYVQHIMHALMECGLTTDVYGELYRELFTAESQKNVLVKPNYAETAEVLTAIHDAGGIAVLSHAQQLEDTDILERLTALGLDGVEVWTPETSPEQSEALFAYAKKHSLLATGGSNFKGLYNKSAVSVGTSVTPDIQLNEFMGYKAKQRKLHKKAEAAAAAAATDSATDAAEE